MTGTGLKKCVPTTCERRRADTAAASRVTEIELVLVPMMARAGRSASSSASNDRLMASSSKTASMASTAPPAASASEAVAATRASWAADSAAVRRPLRTARSRLPAMRARPASARASSGS